MPLWRLKLAVLPLDLPSSGLKTQWGKILTTDKPHKKKTDGLSPKDESEIWHVYIKIELRSFIMLPEGVRSLNSQNGGTTDLQWPSAVLWQKKMFCMYALHCEMCRRMIMLHVRRVFYLIFKKKPGQKPSTVIIYINLFFRMSITQDGNKSSVKVQPADSWRNRLAYPQDGRLFLTLMLGWIIYRRQT